MTEQEVKDKIKNLLSDNMRWQPYYAIMRGIVYEQDLDNLADALIEAGLIFDKTTVILAERTNSKTLIHKAQYYDEMKHRAEVAEMALKNACEDVKEIVSFLIELSERVDGLHVEGYLPEESEPKAYINRAEKELAEEGKDENN